MPCLYRFLQSAMVDACQRSQELVAQAGKRWEGILRRAAGGKGNAKRRRSDSCQPRQA